MPEADELSAGCAWRMEEASSSRGTIFEEALSVDAGLSTSSPRQPSHRHGAVSTKCSLDF
jgi:hypothetical protein